MRVVCSGGDKRHNLKVLCLSEHDEELLSLGFVDLIPISDPLEIIAAAQGKKGIAAAGEREQLIGRAPDPGGSSGDAGQSRTWRNFMTLTAGDSVSISASVAITAIRASFRCIFRYKKTRTASNKTNVMMTTEIDAVTIVPCAEVLYFFRIAVPSEY